MYPLLAEIVLLREIVRLARECSGGDCVARAREILSLVRESIRGVRCRLVWVRGGSGIRYHYWYLRSSYRGVSVYVGESDELCREVLEPIRSLPAPADLESLRMLADQVSRIVESYDRIVSEIRRRREERREGATPRRARRRRGRRQSSHHDTS